MELIRIHTVSIIAPHLFGRPSRSSSGPAWYSSNRPSHSGSRLVSICRLRYSIWPSPLKHVRPVCTVLVGVIAARNLCVSELVHRVSTDLLNSWNTFNDVHGKSEAVDLILDC